MAGSERSAEDAIGKRTQDASGVGGVQEVVGIVVAGGARRNCCAGDAARDRAQDAGRVAG